MRGAILKRNLKAASWVIGLFTLASGAALARPPALLTAAPGYVGFGVSTENPTATRDAAQILQTGGSAADAAVVAALVAGVASPTSSGIGGGGFVVGWDPKTGPYVIDFREVGASGLVREPFEQRPLALEERANLTGVPGEVRGLFELHRRAGTKRWADLVKVAANRAHQGFTVSAHLGAMLAYGEPKVKPLPGFAGVFYPGGKPALTGSRLTHPALGRTLDKIAAEGPDGFYKGSVAEDIVAAAQANGGKIGLADLENYREKSRTALKVDYEGYEVYTMPPPSAGGLMMVQTLKMFPADYLRALGHGTPAYQHVLAEALRAAVADRMMYLGDPDFTRVNVAALIDDKRMEERRAKIVLDRTHSIPRFKLDEKGTHALVTADRAGNVISLTTTVNHLFGAKIYSPESGVILNNELDDFSARADVEPFDLSETPNPARPNARPLSSMTPTIVIKDGVPVLALGGSGGTAIATNATQALLAALVFDHEPQQAVSADRFYIPTSGPHIRVEKGTNAAHVADLERRGEVVAEMPFSGTAIQMLRFDGGKVRAAADPRKHGLAISGR